MMKLRAFTVSVDYSDFLAVTLPWNRRHFAECCVVTTPGSKDAEVARRNSCSVFTTDAFHRDGASFNRWLALEEAMSARGRDGWIALVDADVMWPRDATNALERWDGHPSVEYLYSPYRRMMDDARLLFANGVPPEGLWSSYRLDRGTADRASHTLMFHGSDAALGRPPWFDVGWKHAGGADSAFRAKWPEGRKLRPPFEVLHAGPAGVNWFGRSTPLADGTVLPGSEERRKACLDMWLKRRERGYDGERVTA